MARAAVGLVHILTAPEQIEVEPIMNEIERMTLLTRSPLWAIRPENLSGVLDSIVHGSRSAAGWEAVRPSQRGEGKSKAAVIPVQGVLTKDGPRWLGNSYESIGDSVEKAVADASVKLIVMDVDSPGGEVTGLPEAASVIAQAAKVKPVSALVSGQSASAAFWLTSQANDITLTPSGEVGSVGVRMMHMDMSKNLEDQGIKVTELFSGDFKNEWSPFSPLTDGAKADMQSRLEDVHSDFVNAVAKGRGIRATSDIQRSRFGEGRMLSAQDALRGGLVDRLESPHQFYKRVLTPATSRPDYGLPLSQQHELVEARLWLERARLAAARRM
jgi:signal peptide peptidase SppA